MIEMENPYLPFEAEVKRIKPQTHDVKTYTLTFRDEERQREFSFRPGQFNQVSLLGYGEAPISISSEPGRRDSFDHTIKAVGVLTNAIARLKEGETLGVRGPYGNGWPIEEAMGKDILIVAGGVGLAPVRSLIAYIHENRSDFGKLEILYGSRTPDDLLFKDEFDDWRRMRDIKLMLTVDRVLKGQAWGHHVGVVTTLFDRLETSPRNSIAVTCGPEIMMRFVVRGLLRKAFSGRQIFVSLERQMQCGIAKCGHCQIGPKYVCLDGPVFRYSEIVRLPGLIV